MWFHKNDTYNIVYIGALMFLLGHRHVSQPQKNSIDLGLAKKIEFAACMYTDGCTNQSWWKTDYMKLVMREKVDVVVASQSILWFLLSSQSVNNKKFGSGSDLCA